MSEPIIRARRPWSPEDVERLLQLREVDKLTFGQIDRLLKRSPGGSQQKYEAARRPPVAHPTEAGGRIHLSAAQEADRRARLAAENRQSALARLLGDPPPGFSALDRKNADCGGASSGEQS